MKNLEKIIDLSKEIMLDSCQENDNGHIIFLGEIGYTKDNLRVIYKINRLFELNIISLKSRNILIDLYNEKIRIEDLFFSAYDNDKEDILSEELAKIEKELDRYHLLEENVDYSNLIDFSINHENHEKVEEERLQKLILSLGEK